MSRFRSVTVVLLMAAACLGAAAAEVKVSVEKPYVFTDGKAAVLVPEGVKEAAYSIRTITADGYGPTKEDKAAAAGGRIEIAPLAEGIHIVALKLDPLAEVRFLAIAPPGKLDKAAVAKTLPRNGAKLFGNAKFTILAMGDSVANTGDYEGMLVAMLSRATGNANITFVDKSHAGRSVDAAVRSFKDDAVAAKPDLGLLMYGLNDQAAGCPLEGYLEQYQWVAEHLAADCKADTVFMMPTPHIEIPVDEASRSDLGSAKPDSPPPWSAFRTIGFAESLRPLAGRLGVPLAETFAAIWGKGGDTIEDSAKKMWPKYPPGYNDQMKSRIETDGKGDTIHPNALGHLAMARAVYEAIAGRKLEQPLAISGESCWTATGLVSKMTAMNVSKGDREGKLAVYPLMDAQVSCAGPVAYKLKPGDVVEFEVAWPAVKRVEDLNLYPNNRYLAPGMPMIPVVDFAGGTSTVYGATAPFEVDINFVRTRQVCDKPFAEVQIADGKQVKTVKMPLPPGDAGRAPMVQKTTRNGKPGGTAAELVQVRFGAALAGEANVDGILDEWADAKWSPVGERCQARWVRGQEDNRAKPSECNTRWAWRAGKQGIYAAIRAFGKIEKDRFTIFFDTRSPEQLGTVGPYYWVSGSLAADGTVPLDKGETSKEAPGMKGTWLPNDEGGLIELFIPYKLMELDAWPAGKDLGASIWWVHTGPDGKVTNIMWSEDGHPWNTRWYGVVRLVDDPKAPLPCVVRVK